MHNRIMVRGALLVALALALQSIRLVIPIPNPFSTFIIGTLVHMMLALTLRMNGLATAVLLSFLLPLTAYMQGQLVIPFLIPVVWLGNLLFVLLLQAFSRQRALTLFVPAAVKAAVMFTASWLVVTFLHLPGPAVRRLILFAMSVPQLVTAVAGVWLARRVLLSLRNI